ncbi:dihydroneopterin aldolase [Rickettsiales endosymbiont of Stachyamoeba lipophora]|uniref:dihydroneopterin aldolase n=1 Tax=Rickettsiales endosymbiont of Stachyamoeba lipophora TaxID=2486578 RepID=UPI000F654BC5|nr:dihydroneopterin aldolase [Rickettsiales endosymbiont of Stachyamoeba lipophora]AZL16207.1 dihydroneopterin aldolase [Rickettsiales endosymbiont of Stachyamoeba lipophora]
MHQTKYKITINKIILDLHIGITNQERAISQPIQIDLEIILLTAPKAFESDNINDTICYHAIYTQVTTFLKSKIFSTLEYLAYNLHSMLKKTNQANEFNINLHISKLHPPISGHNHPITFSLIED